MKKYLVFATALIVAFSACKKENILDPNADSDINVKYISELSVSLPLEAKAQMGEAMEGVRKVTWDEGDRICANGVVSDALTAEQISEGSAVFTFTENPLPEAASYKMCYPESVWVDESTIDLPAARTIPMAGVCNAEGHGSMKHLCAYVKFLINSETKLEKIQVRGNAAEQMSGKFTLDYSDMSITGTSKALCDQCTSIICKEGEYIAAIPAGEYPQGIQLRVINAAGEYMTKKTTLAKTFTRASVSTFAAFDFAKTGAYFSIATAQDWNDFASECTNGSNANVKTTIAEFVSDIDFTGTVPTALCTISKGYEGELSGEGHCIKNLKLTTALIPRVATAANIHDIVFDSSCSFEPDFSTYDSSVSYTAYFGALASVVFGTVQDIVMNAPTIIKGTKDPAANIYCGCLVGVNNGTIKNCSNTAAVTLENLTLSKELQAGAICGSCNKDVAKVESCKVTCKITVAESAVASKIFFGGITGAVTGNGGILSNNTVTSAIAYASASAYNYLGAITGNFNNEAGLKVSDGNTASSTITITGNGTSTYCGGHYGHVGKPITATLSGTPFTGGIKFNSVKDKTYTDVMLGGLYGKLADTATLTGSGLKLSNNVAADVRASAFVAAKLCIGGVAGYSAKDFTLDGKGCSINASGNKIYIWDSSIEFKPTIAGLGCILGGADAAVAISNVTNNCAISNNITTKVTTANPLHVGGIVGYVNAGTATGSKLSNCNNTASIDCKHYYNKAGVSTSNSCGGIIGLFTSSATTTALTISECSNCGSIYAYRGACGGIAGNVINAEFKLSCSNSGSILLGQPAGGIAGYATSSTLTDCTNTAASIKVGSVNDMYSGGIIGGANTVTLNNCKSNSEILTGSTGASLGSLIGKASGTNKVGANTTCYAAGKVGATGVTTGNVLSTAIGGTTLSSGVALWENTTKRLSVIGDSISTFEGMLPSGNSVYYTISKGYLTDWTQTYWGALINKYMPGQLSFEKNISWSGSCVAQDNRTGKDFRPAFVTRYGKSNYPSGSTYALNTLGSADIVIIYGGTNDYGNRTAGLSDVTETPSDEQFDAIFAKSNDDLDDTSFVQAYVKLINMIHADLAGAKIVCIIGDEGAMCSAQQASIIKIANHFDFVKHVDFQGKKSSIGKASGVHPNVEGMDFIANTIYTELGEWMLN